MRIPKQQLNFIKKTVIANVPDAQVFLFGSRLNDSKSGGDIDILILSSKLLTYKEKFQITLAVEKKFGEQKLDLVNFTFKDNSTFKKLILLDAVAI